MRPGNAMQNDDTWRQHTYAFVFDSLMQPIKCLGVPLGNHGDVRLLNLSSTNST
ncbi:hypothetical protein TNCT_157531, partial [Trichonephila clavata]